MTNKTFSIQNHGLAQDNVFTLKYTLKESTSPFTNPDCYKDLVNLTQEEMISLRDLLDRNITCASDDPLKDFLAGLKLLAKRHNAHGRINTDDIDVDYSDSDRGTVNNPSYISVGYKSIKSMNFDAFSAVANYSELKSVQG